MKICKEKILTQEEMINLFYEHVVKNGEKFKKTQLTLIRPGVPGERIETIVDSGLETVKIVEPNEFVVQALTQAEECYVITEEKFKTRYELSSQEIPLKFKNKNYLPYTPKGKILAIKAETIMKDLEGAFIAKWGSPMKVLPEDMLAVPLGLEAEIYRVAWSEFLQTYTKD